MPLSNRTLLLLLVAACVNAYPVVPTKQHAHSFPPLVCQTAPLEGVSAVSFGTGESDLKAHWRAVHAHAHAQFTLLMRHAHFSFVRLRYSSCEHAIHHLLAHTFTLIAGLARSASQSSFTECTLAYEFLQPGGFLSVSVDLSVSVLAFITPPNVPIVLLMCACHACDTHMLAYINVYTQVRPSTHPSHLWSVELLAGRNQTLQMDTLKKIASNQAPFRCVFDTLSGCVLSAASSA